jgi:hypothetical protein
MQILKYLYILMRSRSTTLSHSSQRNKNTKLKLSKLFIFLNELVYFFIEVTTWTEKTKCFMTMQLYSSYTDAFCPMKKSIFRWRQCALCWFYFYPGISLLSLSKLPLLVKGRQLLVYEDKKTLSFHFTKM